MMRALDTLAASIDWADLGDVWARLGPFLREFVDGGGLADELRALPGDPGLVALCEHYDILDKLVLYDHPGGRLRLRLHVFLPGHFDRPHNHRWSYGSLILRGRYRHVLYGDDDGLTADADPSAATPLVIREESAGSFYALDHRMVHAVTADPYSVSLVARGPAVKDRFVVMDRLTKAAWWQYGRRFESAPERSEKAMTPERLRAALAVLRDLDVY